MNAIRKAGLLLGAALMAGCIERNAPTALRNQPGVAFDAAGLTSVVNDSPGDVKNGSPAGRILSGPMFRRRTEPLS